LERGLVETEYARADKEAKGVLNNAGVVIKKTAEVCDSLDKIKKFGESTWSFATSVGPLLLLHVDKLMK
jgi:hypothetical protein